MPAKSKPDSRAKLLIRVVISETCGIALIIADEKPSRYASGNLFAVLH